MASASLLSLPNEVLISLPTYLHNIEDYTNLASTCVRLRLCLATASPNTILRLAAAQSTTFFRPSPHYLVAATARELGNWARQSDANEATLTARAQDGLEGLLNLALQHCGLTMARIRELFLTRFSIVNPVTDVMDQCVGQQWYAQENFWDGGVSDAYTINSDPAASFFHLAMYGELFAPDLDRLLAGDTQARRLSVATRLEIVKYCIPDFAVECADSEDPRRLFKATGPYARDAHGDLVTRNRQNNIALTWILRSTRWRPHWRALRRRVAGPFQANENETWWSVGDETVDWRQRLWEYTMYCQGWEGMGMMRPELQDQWVGKVKQWREQIASLEQEPPSVRVDLQTTREYPFLLGDLRVCASGYVLGT